MVLAPIEEYEENAGEEEIDEDEEEKKRKENKVPPETETIRLELRAVPVYQSFEEHTGGFVIKFLDMNLVEDIGKFVKQKVTVTPSH